MLLFFKTGFECSQAFRHAENCSGEDILAKSLSVYLFLSQVPGAPIIFATINGIHLETPSEMTKKAAKEVH